MTQVSRSRPFWPITHERQALERPAHVQVEKRNGALRLIGCGIANAVLGLRLHRYELDPQLSVERESSGSDDLVAAKRPDREARARAAHVGALDSRVQVENLDPELHPVIEGSEDIHVVLRAELPHRAALGQIG